MSSSPAAPGLGDLLEPTALHRLPKTRAPLCGYSRGLHAPNERCKSSLKEPFWFLSKKSGLALTWSSPEGVLQLSDARQFDVPECGHSPVLTPQLHRAPQSSTKLLARSHHPNCPKGLGQGHFPDARRRCLLLPALCFGGERSINLQHIHFQDRQAH